MLFGYLFVLVQDGRKLSKKTMLEMKQLSDKWGLGKQPLYTDVRSSNAHIQGLHEREKFCLNLHAAHFRVTLAIFTVTLHLILKYVM